MTSIDAVRAYRDAWLRSQSLHGYAVVAAADAAIEALEAENERLSEALTLIAKGRWNIGKAQWYDARIFAAKTLADLRERAEQKDKP